MFILDDSDQHHLVDDGQLVDKLLAQITDIMLLDECIGGTILVSVNAMYEGICYHIGYVPIPLVGMPTRTSGSSRSGPLASSHTMATVASPRSTRTCHPRSSQT